MYILKILFVILIILFIFIILTYVIKKNSFYELFETIDEKGLLCGTEYDICRIDQYGKNSCCDGYSCIRPNGNFEDKVCVGTDGTNKNTWLSKIFNINDFVSFPTSYEEEELCEEEEEDDKLVAKLKDLCGNPYKLNFNIPKCPRSYKYNENDNTSNYLCGFL